MEKLCVIILLFFSLTSFSQDGGYCVCSSGEASFVSDAPLELIKASTKELEGVLNLEDRSFAFQISSKSFQGFNSSLQRTHFNEDYLESELYPQSTFKGKIIEEVDLSKPGKYTVRAKGKLYIHGVSFDRIIRCSMLVDKEKINVEAKFTVFLDDHNISIPTIVNQKIAEEIQVDIKLNLLAQ
jgi:polyisoprenoid-binding protein YceI